MKSPKIYIAGSMSGKPNNNYTQFHAKASELRATGWIVINPAELDAEAGLDPAEEFTGYDYEDAAKRDVDALHTVDAIYMLSGWEHSKGAAWEHAIATHLGLLRYYELPRADHVEKHKRNVAELKSRDILNNPEKHMPLSTDGQEITIYPDGTTTVDTYDAALQRVVRKTINRSSLTAGRTTASAGDNLFPEGSIGAELQKENPFFGRPIC